jgi:hypothetical protein
MKSRLVRSYGKKTSKMEEEGPDALEVGPQAHAAKDAQDGTEESIRIINHTRHRTIGECVGELFISRRHLLRRSNGCWNRFLRAH